MSESIVRVREPHAGIAEEVWTAPRKVLTISRLRPLFSTGEADDPASIHRGEWETELLAIGRVAGAPAY